ALTAASISKVGLVIGHPFFANDKEMTQNSEHYRQSGFLARPLQPSQPGAVPQLFKDPDIKVSPSSGSSSTQVLRR
ncbi:hypothetical protein, partial [uncultured Microbulbifer sp.]|uniref:hypothetical protein n=1 Tax=uncultured Microbulbifer sp. TaxID=348147 RepID=UPI0026307DCF